MLKVWDINVDSDEGYWILTVKTDDCDGADCVFKFQLPADVAEQLHRGVRKEIDPWVQEKEDARSTLVCRVSAYQVSDELEAGVYDGDIGKQIWARGVVSGDIPL
jgi:hypothetical protein